MTADPHDHTSCPTCGRQLPSDQPICRECWSAGGHAPGSSAGAIAIGVAAKYRKPIARVGARVISSVVKVTRFFDD